MINFGQTFVAFLEAIVLTNMNVEKSLIIAVAVGLSSVAQGRFLTYSAMSEKYLVEPTVAGVLAIVGEMLLKRQGNMLRTFSEAFVVAGSSAGLNAVIVFNNRDKALATIPDYQQFRNAGIDSNVSA